MMRLGWARDDARAAAAGLCVMESQGSYAALEDRVSAAIAAADPSLFDSLALEVFDFQRASNRAYGAYCRQLGLPNSLGNWRQIPALPQSAFKLAPLWAFPADATAATFRTSGTTGEGYGEHHFCSLRLYDDAILRGWDLLKLPLLPQILLIPPPSAASHSSLSHMMGTLKERALRGEQHWCFTNGALDLAQDCGACWSNIRKPPSLFSCWALRFPISIGSNPILNQPSTCLLHRSPSRPADTKAPGVPFQNPSSTKCSTSAWASTLPISSTSTA